MPALETARRVLAWALHPSGPPPRGDLTDIDQLTTAAAATAAALPTSATAGRLGWPLTPRSGAIGPTAAVLAAAVGARDHYPAPSGQPGLVDLLFHTVQSEEGSDAELIARHAVVGPALADLSPSAAALGRRASPLTAVLDRPADEQGWLPALRLVARLTQNRASRRVLLRWLARPSERPDVLRWRAGLLDRFRVQPALRPFVLDVYEFAVAFHSSEWLTAIRAAETTLDTEATGAPIAPVAASAASAKTPPPPEPPAKADAAEAPSAPRNGDRKFGVKPLGKASATGASAQKAESAPRPAPVNEEPEPPEDDPTDVRLLTALWTANWWGALAGLQRTHLNDIRQRPELDPIVFLRGTDLFQRIGRLQ
jgi:hypothetical protein